MVGGIDPIDTIQIEFIKHNAHRPLFHSLKVNGTSQATQFDCSPSFCLTTGGTVGGRAVSSLGLSICPVAFVGGRDRISAVSETHLCFLAVHSHYHGSTPLFAIGGWIEHLRAFLRWLNPVVSDFNWASVHQRY